MIWSERANACTPHAVDSKGGGRSSGISRRMSANRFLATAPCAIWNVILRAWPMMFTLILISLSLSVVIDASLIGSGVASGRRKLPSFQAKAWG